MKVTQKDNKIDTAQVPRFQQFGVSCSLRIICVFLLQFQTENKKLTTNVEVSLQSVLKTCVEN